MTSRRVDVFFYGLFMDGDLLRSKGADPQSTALASVEGFALSIGRRAALVPQAGARVHGLVVSLTLEEVDRLYADPTLREYRPEAVLAELAAGGKIAALCYNLAQAPSPSDHDPAYAARLRALAARVGLPRNYVDSLS